MFTYSIPKIEAASLFETSVKFYKITRHRVVEGTFSLKRFTSFYCDKIKNILPYWNEIYLRI